MPEAKDGASIGVEASRPSIDLAAALGMAAQHIAPASGPPQLDFIQGRWRRDASGTPCEGNLVIDLAAFMNRVMDTPEFREFSSKTPFLKGIQHPKGAVTLKIGGRVPEGSEGAIKDAVARISRGMKEGITAALQASSSDGSGVAAAARPLSPRDLWIPADQVPTHFRRVAGRLGATLQTKSRFSIQRVRFTEAGAPGRPDEIARQMTSYEEVEGGDRIEAFLAAAGRHYVSRVGEDQADVEQDIRTWSDVARTRGSDMHRFMNFLDDEGLSRVRLAVSFRIMDALASEARSEAERAGFQRYVSRLFHLYRAVIEEARSDLRIDLVRHFGQDADFSLSDHLVKASFFRALPVWAVWDTQLFEDRPLDMSDASVRREVCYAFKVNGHNPEENKRAFDARSEACLDRLDTGHGCAKALAELLVLDAVLPGSGHDDLDALSAIRRRVEQLQALPSREEAREVLKAALEARSATMDAIAGQMVDVLRTKEADAAVHAVIAAPVILYVNLHDTVLNRQAVDTGKQHPLATQGARADSEHEKVDWLKAVHVSSGSSLVGPGVLFSFQVTVHLGDRSARKTGKEVNGEAERLIRDPVALVNFVPVQCDSDGRAAYDSLAVGTAKAWRADRFSVTMVYAPALLGRRRPRHEDTPIPSENRMAAARVIFASLVQIALEALVDMAEADGQGARGGAGFGPGRMVLLRQQLRGRGAAWDEGDHGVYAVSQAVEHVLGKRLPVMLQGLTSEPHLRDIRSRRSFDAVMSGFDLRIACDGGAPLPLGKLGVIAFASRPCDTDPVEGPGDDDRHVVIGRTYLAEASADGFVLRRGPNLADTYSGTEVTSDPSVVTEAVKHFVDQGCRAIATISHKFAGRAIGRSAIRHMHHESADFQSRLAAGFPGVVFYPLVRDTMRVLRTRDESSRTAFEVVGKDDHIHRYVNQAMRDGFWRRGIVPLYSLATLFHVKARAGMGMRPQSGFSMYYLLLSQSLDFGNAALRSQRALDEGSPDQLALTEVIRAMHLLEAEDGAQKGKAKPVLNPAAWMSPATVAGAGEFRVVDRRRRASGTVELSAVAVVARVAGALRAVREPGPRTGRAPRPGAFPVVPPIVPPPAQDPPASGAADGQSGSTPGMAEGA